MQTRRKKTVAPASRGLTLLELLAAIVVLGTLLVMAPAAYSDWISAQQLANHARFLVDTLHLARSEAIKQGYRVNVCKSADGRQCDALAGWESGWIVFVDENRDGQVEGDERVIRREGRAPEGVTITANHPVADYVSYTGLGHTRMLNGALQMGTFLICKGGQDALRVVIANSGRARIEKTQEHCS
jgi:type IV fimbrial biogenesis protein FimT